MLNDLDITIAGATGAVGREMLAILAARGVAAERLTCLASARSQGMSLPYGDASIGVRALDDDAFSGADLVLLAVGADHARELAPRGLDAGAVVIDNSSAFRMAGDVPLVVPEINGDSIGGARLIANPNCSTIVMLMALQPLQQRYGCERIVVSTYQAVSGAGAAGLDELRTQTERVIGGGDAAPAFFSEPCAFNVFSHDSAVDVETGRNGEEEKMVRETHRIWGDDRVRISANCMRVPVARAHTESINVTLRAPATERDLRAALDAMPGVTIVDDRAAGTFPTPLRASGRDDVLVGRLRPDPSQGEGLGWDLVACGDQLRKGAALNAIQIAERAVQKTTATTP